MPSAKTAGTRDQAKGCGCLLVTVLLIIGGCNVLFGGGATPAPAPAIATTTPVPATTTPTVTRQPEAIDDLDEDGIEDRRDTDADGDGVTRATDRDDQDPSKGKRKPKRTPTPKPTRAEPKSEPAPLAKAHPGGFCGTPGAVGVASNGRTYVCRAGHWRR
ncbi:hypothetical protein [Nonomuraea sp. NPDC050643]|uniref:hypothetical protein n=1 Tax=Nonomuraea sp. NPDC050643 TaxID=3155660 RepID=UPI0033D0AC89